MEINDLSGLKVLFAEDMIMNQIPKISSNFLKNLFFLK